MEDIYIFAIVFAVLMTYFGICWLMPQYNPIWINKQKRDLAAGDVRWGQFSPKYGDGHKIFVIKEFDVEKDGRKHRVIFDAYILTGGEYSMDVADLNYSLRSFLMFSDPEPVHKDERLTPVLKKYIKAESVCGTTTKKSSKKSAQTK